MGKILIGIDPDTERSGVAYYRSGDKKSLHLENLTFFELFDRLCAIKLAAAGDTIVVVVDAGWLNKSNFHARSGKSAATNAQIGERTGANHETGKKIIEMCTYLGLQHELHKPTSSKTNAAYFARLTGLQGRTNQEQRDSGMLVFGR